MVQVTITLDLDGLAKSLDMILIAMGNDNKIQMCSVEILWRGHPYGKH